MNNPVIIDLGQIARSLELPEDSVSRTVELLDEGNTVPFITRYRKDQTGALDEEQIRLIHDRVSKARLLVERKDKIARLIEAKQQLTPELAQQIRTAATIKRLEDLYLPYKPKKQTRATVARQRGLEPLAEELLAAPAEHSLAEAAAKYISAEGELPDEAAVLTSVGHIIAETYSERADLRGKLRKLIRQHGRINSQQILPNPVPATEPQSAEATTAENKTAENKTAENKTAENKTAEEKTAEEKSADEKTAEAATADAAKLDAVPAAEESAEASAPPAVEPADGAEATTPGDSAPGDSAPGDSSAAQDVPASEGATAVVDPSVDAAADPPASPAADSPTASSEPPTVEVPAPETSATETAATDTAATETAATETAATEAAASESTAAPQTEATPPAEAAVSEADSPKTATAASGAAAGKPSGKTVQKLSPRQQKKKKKQEKLQAAFTDYFQFSESIPRLPPHRVLAINRGEKAKILRVRIEVDTDRLFEIACQMVLDDAHPHKDYLKECLRDALQRMVIPSLEREVRRELTEKAEQHAVQVFVRNLRQLLLQPPVHGRRTLAMDPGYRSGCKLVALDEFGGVLGHAVIHVIGNEQRRVRERQKLVKMIRKYGSTIIAIGNGTACRETEQMVAAALQELGSDDTEFVIVNEAGASVYSTSQIGREELPDFDATLRSSVSIGRRLLDPLSELVKINPANIGVGMYQHDVKAKHLRESLESVVESCVNYVGVDVNTASPSLLGYVSGLNQLTARRLFEYRQENGPFKNRNQFRDVPGFGDAAFVQAAGFLKIFGGDNPLDATWIHPESYDVAQRVLESVGSGIEDLVSRKSTPPATGVESETTSPSDDSSAPANETSTGSETPQPETPQSETPQPDDESAQPTPGPTDTVVLPLHPSPPVPSTPAPTDTVVLPIDALPPSAGPSDTVVLPLQPSPPAPTTSPTTDAPTTDAPTTPAEPSTPPEPTSPAGPTPPGELPPAGPTDTVVLPFQPSPPPPLSGETSEQQDAVGQDTTQPESSETPPPGSSETAAPETTAAQPSTAATGSTETTTASTDSVGSDSLPEAPAAPRSSGLQEVVASVVSEKAARAAPAVPVVPPAVLERLAAIDKPELATGLSIGELLLGDILAALSRPGRDPREDFPGPVFRRGIMKMEDLEAGMELSGTVLNVVDFGVFVDIGLSDSALVHISRLADRYVSDPHEVTSVGDVIKVWVLSVDKERRRVSLTAIEPGTEKPDDQRGRRGKKTEKRRPPKQQRQKPPAKKRPPKAKAERKPPKRPKFIPPITKEMEDGSEPMRTFSDLMQFYKKKDD